ncbi:MAG: GTPase Era [Spirochaetaceae bacterium]|jgi:GTP-binding protein Era|nr:GTPase Era [Spirochaetaceae bacterium]
MNLGTTRVKTEITAKPKVRPNKSAFAAIIGRPSVGKSTLLNRLCGAKAAIVSPVPQTTRNSIRGIVNRPEGQIVFVDTPGMHISGKKLNLRLLETAARALDEADIALYVLDASRPPGPEEDAVIKVLERRDGAASQKTVAAINKIDAADSAAAAISDNYLKERLPLLPSERVFYISALRNEGIDAMLACMFRLAPEGPALYGKDCYTDQEPAFRIAEIVREKAMNRLREELPHSIYVDVADMELRSSGTGKTACQTLWVRAFIMAERESQKGMIVGKGGSMIRSIRLAALRDLKKVFDWKIELDLRVKTAQDWRGNDAILKKLV